MNTFYNEKGEQIVSSVMKRNITISQKEMDLINNLLNLTGEEIYQRYGYKRDETITHTVAFPNGIEIDIKLVICEEDKPYTEGVLFYNGTELTHTDCEDTYEGEWIFEYNGISYIVNVLVDKPANDIGKIIWNRNCKEKGIITSESERYCAVCGRHSCYIVKWEDGQITKPCTHGVSYLPNGELIIK